MVMRESGDRVELTRVQLNSVQRRAHVDECGVCEVEEQAPAQAGAVFPCGTSS